MKNSNNKKMISIISRALILIVLFCLYTFFCAFSYVDAVSNDISDSVFRLHVLANSDSKEDQELKYKVRDSLIEYMNSLCGNCTDKNEAIEIANNHIDEFKSIAQNTVKSYGYDYNITVEIGNFEFPVKQYGDISLPAGYYDALRVKIGEAQGQNWWCVMFPPLCFVDIDSPVISNESKDKLEDNLTDEDYALISDNSKQDNFDIQIKFKLLEFFTNNGLITAKK